MIKRTISIVTILLVILGVGIVVTKASPRANRQEEVNRHTYVRDNELRGLVAAEFRLDLVEMTHQRDQVNLQNVLVLDESVRGAVSREMPERLVLDEVERLRGGLAVNVRPTLLNVDDPGDYVYLNDRRNPVDMMEHPTMYSYLAVRKLRVGFPRQLDHVLSGLRPENLQNASVSKTVKMLKEVPSDDVLAAPMLTSFVVSGAEVLRHVEVGKAAPLVREGAVDVTERRELGLAVA